MAVTQLTGKVIKDGSVQRADLDTTTAASAVITKVIAGSNITISSTGVDSGTGDVTVNLTGGTLTIPTAMSSADFREAKGAAVASAATTNIWGTDGNYIHVTGTTTITSLGTAPQAGATRTVVFDGALLLTHNATSLILPGGASITTSAGDSIVVRADTTANMKVISYTYANANVSFTPALKFGGANVGMTGTFTGSYSKVGNIVTFSISIVLTAKGSSVGIATVTGLPYPVGGGFNYPSAIGYYTGAAGLTTPSYYITTTQLNLVTSGAVNVANMTDANFTNTTQILISGTYSV